MWTTLFRTRSSSARKNRGAAPYPPPTSKQVSKSSETLNGRPSGPITSTTSWAFTSESHFVPGPTASSTTSSVPAQPPRREAWWMEKDLPSLWDRDLDELARLGLIRDVGGHQRDGVIGAGAAIRQDFASRSD